MKLKRNPNINIGLYICTCGFTSTHETDVSTPPNMIRCPMCEQQIKKKKEKKKPYLVKRKRI